MPLDVAAMRERTLAELRERIKPAPDDYEASERDAIDGAVGPQSSAAITILADVEPQELRWLWGGRIPLGKITVIDGDPGLGKSTVTLDIAARVSRGDFMPGGAPGALREPSGVVLLSAEDDLADTIRPRLDAAGADVSRVAMLTAIRMDYGERMPCLADLDPIREAIGRVVAKLVVVDPLMAYLTGDAHKDNEVRQSLGPLAKMAAELGIAVVVVRHLNKSGDARNPLYRGGGSIGIIGAARAGLLVARDPDDDARRILAPTKNNLGEPAPSLAFRIVPTASGVARIEWLGPTEHTARALLAPSDHDSEPTAAEEAAAWLNGELRDGPRGSADLRIAARTAGIAWRTIERAKVSLGVLAKRINDGGERGAGAWAWALPGDVRPIALQHRHGIQDRHGGDEGSPDFPEPSVQARQAGESGGLEGADEELPFG